MEAGRAVGAVARRGSDPPIVRRAKGNFQVLTHGCAVSATCLHARAMHARTVHDMQPLLHLPGVFAISSKMPL